MTTSCNMCKGSGNVREPYNIHSAPCCACNGTGVMWKEKDVNQIMLKALKEITTKCSELDYPDCCLISKIAQAAIDAVEGGEKNGKEIL